MVSFKQLAFLSWSALTEDAQDLGTSLSLKGVISFYCACSVIDGCLCNYNAFCANFAKVMISFYSVNFNSKMLITLGKLEDLHPNKHKSGEK